MSIHAVRMPENPVHIAFGWIVLVTSSVYRSPIMFRAVRSITGPLNVCGEIQQSEFRVTCCDTHPTICLYVCVQYALRHKH